MSESDLLAQQEKLRRATVPNIQRPEHALHRRTSNESSRSDSVQSKRDYRSIIAQIPSMLKPRPVKNEKVPNLDYLSLSNTPVASQPQSPIHPRAHPAIPTSAHNPNPIYNNHPYHSPPSSTTTLHKATTAGPSEWEVLLGSLDGGQTNLYDAIYGGPALALTDTNSSSNYGGDWSPKSTWDMNSFSMGDFTSNGGAGLARSVLSFSEESLSSGEDMSGSELLGSRSGDYGSVMMNANGEGYLLDGLDSGFGL